MRQIVKQGQRFSRRVVSDDDARAELAGEPYKLELIGLKGGSEPQDADESVEVGGSELTIYDNLNPGTGEVIWKDLCRGPHLPTTRFIPAFKLMRQQRRVLAGEREERAAAADLRHRLGVPGRCRTSTWPCWPRPSGATTASSAPSWTCSRSRPRSAAGCRCSTPRAASSAG